MRNAVEMYGVDGHDASFAQAGEGGDNDVSAGGESDGAIEFHRWLLPFSPNPRCSERFGELAMGFSAG